MMIRIKNFEHVGDYKLKLLFSDDKTKIVDFKDWIDEGGVYLLPLKNMLYFKKVQIDEFNYSICWPNGADFSPDVLYEIGQEVKTVAKKTTHTPKKSPFSIRPKSKNRAAAKNKL